MTVYRDVLVYGVAGMAGVAGLAGLYFVGNRLLARKSETPPDEGSKLYESQKLLSEYVAFHYCPPEEYMTYDFGPRDSLDFPKRCAELCLEYKPDDVLSRAIDIGCAVGRSTFELARVYDEVVGVDFSQSFIEECNKFKLNGESQYSLTIEGELTETKTAFVDKAIDRSRTSFTVGDACNLPDFGQFGCVFAANLICRLPEPMKFFDHLPDIIVPGGILFITSPYTWLESYTDKDKWIGGFTKYGQDIRGFSSLKAILQANFELLHEEGYPFLIRETVRKHQWTVAHVTIWKRK